MSQLSSNDNCPTDIFQDIPLSQSVNPQMSMPNKSTNEAETALESKFRKTFSNKRLSKHFISEKNIPKIRKSLEGSGILDNNIQTLTVRELPKISQENYDTFKNSFTNQEYLDSLLIKISNTNCNFKSVDSNNSIGGLTPLTYLVESSFSMSTNRAKEINDKYNMLKPYIYNYRTVNGDGNCFYRAIMFRYLEILVLNKHIEYLQNVTYDVYNSLNSEEIKPRLIVGNINIKLNLTINLLILITNLLKKGNVLLAHNTLVRSFSTCRIFDYAIIFYFRYILYDYIKKNEEKSYIKSFPIKLGNLLPSQYETEEGKFLYDLFYTNYLLKFYTDAEKIVIYLTPFVLGIPLNVIIFDDNEEEILQNFKWEEGKGLNIVDEINLLNRKNHYEIIYTLSDNEKYKNIFENYENHKKSVVLNDIEKHLNALAKNSNTDIFNGTFDIKEKEKIDNPKTMVLKRNNLYNIDNNLVFENNNTNINKIELNSNNANQNIKDEKKINNNNKNQKNNNKNNLNPNVQIKQKNDVISNIIDYDNLDVTNNKMQNQKNNNNNNNNIKNINNTNMTKNDVKKINNNQIYNLNPPNNIKQIPDKNNIIQNTSKQNLKEKPNNQVNNQSIPQDNIELNTNQIGKQNYTGMPNQPSAQKNYHPKNNTDIIHSKYSQYNNNNVNQNHRHTQNKQTPNIYNIQKQKDAAIGLKTPGDDHSSKNSGNNQGYRTGKNNTNNILNQLVCNNCKTPVHNTSINLCRICFKNEIINETYSSYLQCFDQNHQYKPEQLINANITITNFKNEKSFMDLDSALSLYNVYFPTHKLGRKDIIFELKQRVCIACSEEIKNNYYIILPCKCRICSKEHLNNYFAFYQDFTRGFLCRCKELYNRHMMMELILIKELNSDITRRIYYYFQKKLDYICCICAKSENIRGYSNTLISLEKPEFNQLLYSLKHFFCSQCFAMNKSTEFFCQICQMKHLFNN